MKHAHLADGRDLYERHYHGVESVRTELLDLRRELERLAGTANPSQLPALKVDGQKSAKEILAFRDRRGDFFDRTLFADPAWDILLGLYVASVEQRRMTVSDVCGSARVPMTTGLRWTKTLEEMNILGRRPDPLDGRRIFISLSEAGLKAMNGLFNVN